MGSKKNHHRQPRHRAKSHVMKGDRVRVIRGNHRELEGTVRRVLPEKGKVILEGINQRKRHERPSQKNPDGGIVTFEAPIDLSNVMLIDPHTEEPTRVRIQRRKDGSRDRISVKSGNVIPAP